MRTLQRQNVTMILAAVLAVLLLAACQGASSTAASDGPTAGDAGTDQQPGEESPGPSGDSQDLPADVLEPLEDGFPSQPITLWNAFTPGSDDDLVNILRAQLGTERYSPVPISTDTQTAGPILQFGVLDQIQSRPGYDEGYHAVATAWFGAVARYYAIPELGDNYDFNYLNPVGNYMTAPYVWIVAKDSPYESLQDLEDALREDPTIRGTASSPGGGLHVSILVWAEQAGLSDNFVFVPADGPAEGRTLVQAGGADFAVTTVYPGIDEEFRVLAVTGDARVADLLPDVPAVSELGYNIPAGSTWGIAVPETVPDEHRDWLHELFTRIHADPQFQQRYQGFIFDALGPDETEAMVENMTDVFVPVMEAAGLTS